MHNKLQIFLSLLIFTAFFPFAENTFAESSFGNNVNALCAPQQPYTGDCSLCHTSDFGAPTPAKSAYLAGGQTLINFFCPAPQTPTCTDNDSDTFAVEGGDCGPVDCNDGSAAIFPGANEICGDGIDQDCDGFDVTCTGVRVPLLLLLRENP